MNARKALVFIFAMFLGACGFIGCNAAKDPNSKQVLFEQIEGVIQDIEMNVSSKHYSGDLGEDRLGPLLTNFQQKVAGSSVEAEVDKLVKKLTEVSTLASKRPKIDALRKSVKELTDAMQEVKKKL